MCRPGPVWAHDLWNQHGLHHQGNRRGLQAHCLPGTNPLMELDHIIIALILQIRKLRIRLGK